MGDNVKSLRKANDNLKKQLEDFAADFQTFKNKMAEKNEAAIASLPTENDVHTLVMVMMLLRSPKRIW